MVNLKVLHPLLNQYDLPNTLAIVISTYFFVIAFLDLNKLEQRPQKQLVKVVQDVARLEDTPNALMAVEVPSFADHPLVRGPLFSRIKVAVVSVGVDTKMSGVMGMYCTL